jgi:hypothetical protein
MKFGARLRSIVVAAGRAARTVARWLTSTIDLRDLFLAAGLILGAYGLAGKNLACWCALDQPACHANVLLEIANGEGA